MKTTITRKHFRQLAERIFATRKDWSDECLETLDKFFSDTFVNYQRKQFFQIVNYFKEEIEENKGYFDE